VGVSVRIPRYPKIPNFHAEPSWPSLLTPPIYLEEKLDGQLRDTAEVFAEVEGVEVGLYGEYVGRTHTIHYSGLPNDYIVFDVWVEGWGFLPPREKVAAAALFGLPHAPVAAAAQALGPGDAPSLLTARSFFKTTLNPSLCARRWDLCEAFYAAHGREGFAEGAVAKSYQGGRLAAVKFVKREFDKLVQEAGDYEQYPSQNHVTFDLDGAVELTRRNLAAVGAPAHLAEAFAQAYPTAYRRHTTAEIYRDLPPTHRKAIRQIIQKFTKSPNP